MQRETFFILTVNSVIFKATEEYLLTILDLVRESNFRSLFGLSRGSALAVVIDTSGSMGSEIQAVKDQVKEIVEKVLAGGLDPSLYILTPYERLNQVFQTENPTEFLAFLNTLTVAGGTENLHSALLNTLTVAPPFTDVLVFTDEDSDDFCKWLI